MIAFCVLRVGGELKKSELDAVQFEFVEKIAGVGNPKWEGQVWRSQVPGFAKGR